MEQKSKIDPSSVFQAKSVETSFNTQDKSNTEKIKQAFPLVRFAFSSLLMLMGILACFFVTRMSPVNPMPFANSFNVLEWQSWIYPLERDAVLRVPRISSTVPIQQVADMQPALGLRFADNRTVMLNPDGSLSEVKASELAGSEESVTAENIIFDLQREDALSVASGAITKLLQRVKLDSLKQVRISVYLSPSQDLRQQDLEILRQQPKKTKAEEPKESKSESGNSYNNALAQQDSESIAISIAEFVQSKVKIDRENIVSAGYGTERHYDQGWKQSAGAHSGVYIEFVSEVSTSLFNWLSVEEFSSTQRLMQAELPTWNLIKQDIIVLIDESGRPKTVAILPSALQRYYNLVETDDSTNSEVNSVNSDSHPSYLDRVPEKYPSPLSLLVLIGMSFFALRLLTVQDDQRDVDVIKHQHIVDSFVSDAPAIDLSQDRLGFVEISSALSRFMRNAGTKAPLTIAITGVWGSGKSSLMYFLKQNLESFRMHPVWINAWHHQNEEQFLAGLLSAIESKAIPGFWTSSGILYRWNLLRMRWSESPLFFFFSTTILLVSLGYLMTSRDASFAHITELSEQTLPLLGAIFGGVSLIRGGMDRISGMINTNILAQLFRTPGRNLDLRSNVGLREKFAKEFKMLCDALGDSTLTIFIDDLDRCKEQRIMDVMETINYLVSSGDCFIILGMEREPIEKAIAAYYAESHAEEATVTLEEKAKRYLEKIINIEIPVPFANAEQFDKLVDFSNPLDKKPSWTWVKPLLLMFFFVFSLVAGSYFAGLVTSHFEDPKNQVNAVIDNATEDQQNEAFAGEPSTARTLVASPDSGALVSTTPEIAENEMYVLIPFLLLIIVALIIRVERYRQRKRIVETDSNEFLHAISIWAKALGITQHTPRSIKRYVNRARYLAMRNYESKTEIREDNLVTLAAILEFNSSPQTQQQDLDVAQFADLQDSELKQQMDALLNKSEQVDENKRKTFMHWVKGISVN